MLYGRASLPLEKRYWRNSCPMLLSDSEQQVGECCKFDESRVGIILWCSPKQCKVAPLELTKGTTLLGKF